MLGFIRRTHRRTIGGLIGGNTKNRWSILAKTPIKTVKAQL